MPEYKPFSNYNYTDERIHQLCQIIAKANRTFVEKRSDDSHTNLFLDPVSKRIYGRWITHDDEKIILCLNLQTFHFSWLNTKRQSIQKIPLLNKKTEEIEKDLRKGLELIRIDEPDFSQKLHFEIPDYPFAGQAVSLIDTVDIDDWVYLRSVGNKACFDFLGFVQSEGEVRIWPHHFDTGVYTKVNERLSLGFGLAMKDENTSSPYLYISGYPAKGEIEYNNMPDFDYGEWRGSDSWKGAVLPLIPLVELEKEKVNTVIDSFIEKTASWFLNY